MIASQKLNFILALINLCEMFVERVIVETFTWGRPKGEKFVAKQDYNRGEFITIVLQSLCKPEPIKILTFSKISWKSIQRDLTDTQKYTHL